MFSPSPLAKSEMLGKLSEDTKFWGKSPSRKENGLLQKVGWVKKLKPAARKKLTVVPQEPQSTTDEIPSDSTSGITASDDADLESQKTQSFISSDSSSDSNKLSLKVQVMETLISNLLDAVRSLESSYAQIQSGHEPYDPNKLLVADKAVVSGFRKISELKHSYDERLALITSCQTADDSEARPEALKERILQSYGGLISNFHAELCKKNTEVEKLKDMLAQSTLKKEKLERRLKRLEEKVERASCLSVSNGVSPDPQLLESIVRGASEAARSFAKLLVSLMKIAKWDLDAAANAIEPGIRYARREDQKLVFQSYVSHRMLSGFENENFYIDGNFSSVLDPEKNRQECFIEFQELTTADPMDLINANPDCRFAKFCLKKFVDLVHPKMEESFFGTMELRKQVLNGEHPNSQFYKSYLKLAKAIWLLHRLAFSFEPNASIFQAKRNVDFSPLYMEKVVQNTEIDMSSLDVLPKVGFTVMPGFRAGRIVIKCQVYTVECLAENTY